MRRWITAAALFAASFGSSPATAFETTAVSHSYGFASLDDAKRFATLIWVEKDDRAGQAFARQRNEMGELKEFRKGARVIVEDSSPDAVPGADGASWRCARLRGDPTCYWAPDYLLLPPVPYPAGSVAPK